VVGNGEQVVAAEALGDCALLSGRLPGIAVASQSCQDVRAAREEVEAERVEPTVGDIGQAAGDELRARVELSCSARGTGGIDPRAVREVGTAEPLGRLGSGDLRRIAL